jgi:DNA-binding CsgD family transcriptional regulator/tetratricopeptide (TPR) repeat protein
MTGEPASNIPDPGYCRRPTLRTVGTFVGRQTELATLVGALDEAAAGHLRLTLIEGEAGIGKSRLVEEVAEVARGRGFAALLGRADEVDRGRSMGPLLEALGQAYSPIGGQEPRSQHEHREWVLGALEAVVAGTPTLLVVEDLQWADPASVAALSVIPRRLEGLPLLVALTARPVPRDRALEQALRRLDGSRVSLGPLSEAEAQALASAAPGADGGGGSAEFVRRAGGNPFFILELVRAARVGDGGHGLPPDIARAARERLADLSPDTETVVRVASVLGSTFTLADLAVICDQAPASLLPALSEALRAGVLGEQHDRIVFRHDLVRDAAYETVPPSARAALHRDAGRALAAAHAPATKVAAQLRLAAEPGDDEAIEWLRRAADEEAADPLLAAELLQQAIALAPHRDRRRPAIAHDLAVALVAAGRLRDAAALCREAMAEADDPVVTAALQVRLVHALVFSGRGNDALVEVAAAVGSPDVEQAALISAYAAMARVFIGEFGPAAEAARAVLAGPAGPLGSARCFAEIVLSVALRLQGRPAEALDHADRAVAIARRAPTDDPARYDPEQFRAMCLVDLGRPDDLALAIESGRASAERLGLAWNLPGHHYLAARRNHLRGEWDDALAEIEAGLALDAEVVSPDLPDALAAHALLLVARGDLAAGAAALQASDEARAAAGSLMGADTAAAATAALREAEDHPDPHDGLDQVWTLLTLVGVAGNRPFIAADLVRAAIARGDQERAATIASDMAALAADAGSSLYAAAAQHCAGIARGDEVLLGAAAAAFAAAEVRVLEARAVEDLAGLSGSADPARTRELIERALAIYEAAGASRDAARATSTLRSFGLRRGARGARRRPATGWGSLTPTELAVAERISEGLTTAQVATRLYISPHTVSTHVKHMFAKLGISSRVELVALASRHRPPGGR